MYIGLEIPPSIRTVTSPYKAEQTTDKPVVVFLKASCSSNLDFLVVLNNRNFHIFKSM